MPKTPRVTLRQLAEAAGVSVGTVSQALRGKGTTSRRTQEEIRRLAAEMDYVPDPLMAQMGARSRHRESGRTEFPILVAVLRHPDFKEAYSDELMEDAMVKTAREHGYVPWLREVWSSAELKRLLREYYWRGGRGVLLWNVHDATWLESQDWSPFSVVQLGGRHYFPRFHTVECDATMGYALAMEAAVRVGRSVGAIRHYHKGEDVLDDITRGGVEEHFRKQIKAGKFVPTLRLPFHLEEARAESKVITWWRRYRPEVVVGFPLGHTLLRRCEEARHVRFIFCDGCDSDGISEGICEPLEEICRQAVQRLEAMIRHHETGQPEFPSISSVPPQWIQRHGSSSPGLPPEGVNVPGVARQGS